MFFGYNILFEGSKNQNFDNFIIKGIGAGFSNFPPFYII